MDQADQKNNSSEENSPDFQEDVNKLDMNKLKEELAKCEISRKEHLEGWQRAKADFINYKNDEARRFEDIARFITTGLMQDILPVLDSFDLAFQYQMPPEMEKGVLLIRSQFEDVLKKHGLKEIAVHKGDAFTPEMHESIGELESELPESTIAEIVQKGYILGGRILRASRVRLSKKL